MNRSAVFGSLSKKVSFSLRGAVHRGSRRRYGRSPRIIQARSPPSTEWAHALSYSSRRLFGMRRALETPGDSEQDPFRWTQR